MAEKIVLNVPREPMTYGTMITVQERIGYGDATRRVFYVKINNRSFEQWINPENGSYKSWANIIAQAVELSIP